MFPFLPILPAAAALGSFAYHAVIPRWINQGTSDLSTQIQTDKNVGTGGQGDTVITPSGLVSWAVDNRSTNYTDNTQTTTTTTNVDLTTINDNDTHTTTNNYTYNYELGGGNIRNTSEARPSITPSTTTTQTPSITLKLSPEITSEQRGSGAGEGLDLVPIIIGLGALAAVGGLGYVAVDNLTKKSSSGSSAAPKKKSKKK